MSTTNGIFIDPTTGNVGIGTTIPLAKLHINNDILRTKQLIIDILDGTAPTRAAPSAKFLKDTYNYSVNGLYWIKPSGFAFPFLTYCDFTTEGGGWTCIRSTVYENRTATNFVYFINIATNSGFPQFNFDLFICKTSIMSALKASTYPEFLMYISNDGTYDTHATNNYAVVKPNSFATDFLQGNGSAVAVPAYGKIRGNNFTSGGLGSGASVSWYFNTNNYEPHIDGGALSGALSSEDNFGFFQVLNTNHYNTGQYFIRMIR